MNKGEIVFVAFLVFCIGTLGWLLNDIYRSQKNIRTLDGLWIKDVNESVAKDIAQERDKFGRWVCVNIQGMELERAVEVCKHEVGHEIFAEYCEKDMERCYNVSA